MIASLYTNQSTHIWSHANAPVVERATPTSRYNWPRDTETYYHYSHLQIVVVIQATVTAYRSEEPQLVRTVLPQTDSLGRALIVEAERIAREYQQRQAEEVARIEQEQRRLARQIEDDEELVFAASILFREPQPITWRMNRGAKRRQ